MNTPGDQTDRRDRSDTSDDKHQPAQAGATAEQNDVPALPKEYGAVGRHRAHQGRWRESTLGWPAGPPTDQNLVAKYPTLPNMLAARSVDGRDVREELVNIMSFGARVYTRDRLPVIAAVQGLAQPDRLYRNLLSSQPLAFSIAGELREHPAAAAAVLGAMTDLPAVGLGVLEAPDSLVPDEHRRPTRPRRGPVRPYASLDNYTLSGVEAEWFPPRWAHTNDHSGFDIAACLTLDGPGDTGATESSDLLEHRSRLLVSIEVKYTDNFSKDKVDWNKYRDHLEPLGLTEQATKKLVDADCSQVLRQVMITDSVVRRGLVPGATVDGRVDAGMAVVLGRHDDHSAQTVAELVDDAVSMPVRFWSHREFLNACAQEDGLAVWAEEMRVRYVP